MRSRCDIEKMEYDVLTSYAMKSGDSLGRQYPEAPHDSRTAFQRDRDRIVHCEAFRKLEYKTQVFVIFEGDYYRTRLTHTIEVAQLARTIGRNLQLNEDLIEAVALAHDLGHSPFGHAGEMVLDERLKKAGIADGFNHNQRSFEVVTAFEKRYPHFNGLNLTVEVLVGILKHETLYDKVGRALILMDKDFTHKVMTSPCSLEAKVVDQADSLAYLNHDIDDGLTSGCILVDDLNQSALWCQAVSRIQKRENLSQTMFQYQVVKELIDMQARDLLTTTYQRIQDYQIHTLADVAKCENHIVTFSETMLNQRKELQDILNEKFYQHWRVERMTSKAKRILDELFNVYLDNPKQLPYDIYDRGRSYTEQELHMLVCQYIASMTDRAALDEYQRFFSAYKKV